MRYRDRFAVLAVILFPFLVQAASSALPRLDSRGQAVQLLVDGEPWIALAGEVHNSSASNRDFMVPMFEKLARLHVNTVVTPVYWELVEPAEGRYNFTLVDDQVREARQRGMRLVLLWFGTLKNAKSTYAPEWVRADLKRFPRAVIRPSSLPFAQGGAPRCHRFAAYGYCDPGRKRDRFARRQPRSLASRRSGVERARSCSAVGLLANQ
jgi:hypothetical protein